LFNISYLAPNLRKSILMIFIVGLFCGLGTVKIDMKNNEADTDYADLCNRFILHKSAEFYTFNL